MKYRVVGADPATGEPRQMEVEASSAGEAERLGVEAGLVVEQVMVARERATEVTAVSVPPATRPREGSEGVTPPATPTALPATQNPPEGASGTDRTERDVWSGGPSQWGNFPAFAMGVVLAFLVVPAVYALIVLLETRFTRYELTTQRLRTRQGVLNKRVDEIELYRVRDFTVEQSLWQRLVRVGSVRLVTSDRSHPEMLLCNIADHGALADRLREHTETMRRLKRVRELDVE